jgi:hypothetical protein
MPEITIKRRLEDTRNAAPASDDGPIVSTVVKLVEALKPPFLKERKTRSLRMTPYVSRVNCSAEPSTSRSEGRRSLTLQNAIWLTTV